MTLNRPLLTDLSVLVARLGIGGIFIAHGWQKLHDWTLAGTADIMAGGGVPLPTISAYFTTFAELAAGTALVVGAAVPLAGLVCAFIMAGAYVFVHAGNGVFVDEHGWGFVLTLGVASLLLAATGSGRFGVDHLLGEWYRSRRTGRREPVGAA